MAGMVTYEELQRVEGAHRRVDCHACQGRGYVSRRELVEQTIEGLRACFEQAPDGRPWIAHVFEQRPDLKKRLRDALDRKHIPR